MSDRSSADFTRQWTAALPKVAAFVGSMVYEVGDRDDVLQDCAVAAMTSYERYDGERPFVGWAIGVARNQVRLYLRRKAKDPHCFDEEALAAIGEAFVRVDEGERFKKLEVCLERLEGRSRQLCEYRYFHGLKPAAIAKEVGMTANGVAKALQRVREQLRDCIETPSAERLS